ncbi:hypothetical protein [Oceanobacillus iheyensis HTE831]|uniref:Uncharacterized protein n=1 Tax=Oceanobacillus iheyensis (strain DSM 14371 / CIP 107618 / JCM 11309 / KCTC 3954 / HTE831) TaxID=221109 RepID=Q8ES49_OCEIH|nr:hypothetical protein [Oceanobacillus iheyensis HTE831]
MNYIFFTLYAILLAVLAFFTGEIVTFIMLGVILVALQNIHGTLKNILKVLKENKLKS